MNLVPSNIKIGVIRGGPSSDYDLSLQTGAHVLEVLSETHRPIDIFISKDGVWHMGGFEKTPERILKNVDVVFVATHGDYGEDGKIQDLLKHHGVLYTGTNKYEAGVALNKFLTKEYLRNLNIKTPVYDVVRQTDDLKQKSKEIFTNIPGPLIVKPIRGGSSRGITVTNNYKDLYTAIYEILSNGQDVIVEEYIKGKEGVVTVVENFRNNDLYSFPPVEVRLEKNKYFFDNESKLNSVDLIHSPGNFSEKEKKEMEKLAQAIHKTMGLRHYSKVDFIVSPKRGVYFLEINSLPSLQKESVITKSLHTVGSSMKEFVHHVLNLALGKNK